MSIASSIQVEHGLGSSYQKVRNVKIIIRDDFTDPGPSLYDFNFPVDNSSINPFFANYTGDPSGYIRDINSTYINISRSDGGFFNSSIFNTPSGYNRGWLYITYEA
jgi:hypothetical protein